MDFEGVILLWGRSEGLPLERCAKIMADDLGLSTNTVMGWHKRRSIPPKYWREMIECARARRLPLTAEDLVLTAARARPIPLDSLACVA